MLNLSYDYRKNLDGTNNTKTGQLRKITNNLDNNRNREYAYDALGRLTTAKGGNNLWQQVYSYDNYGNKLGTTASGVAANGTPIPRDGHAALSYNNQTNRINGFEYDAAGNQTRAFAPDGTTWLRYEYDAANRLVYVKNDAGTVLENYTYGATNARLIKRDGTTNDLTFYAWAGAEVIAEYTELASQPNVVKWTKSYISAGGRLVSTASLNAQQNGEMIEHHHSDRLGTRIVTNPATGGYFEQETLPFGTALNAESSGFTNRRFTSYDRSNTTGLDYAVNRHYDSGQSRFTQVDPIGMSATSLANPQSLNLYAYVENQPTNFIDPDGLLIQICHYEYRSSVEIYGANGILESYTPPSRTLVCEFINIGGGPPSPSGGGGFDFGGGGGGGGGNSSPLQNVGNGNNACGIGFNIGEYSNVQGEWWRSSKNGNWYKGLKGRGPNGATGPRGPVIARANNFKQLGRYSFYTGALISVAQADQALRDGRSVGKVALKTGLDIGIGYAGVVGGLPGAALAGGYFAVDLTIGMDNIIDAAAKKDNGMCRQMLTNRLGPPR